MFMDHKLSFKESWGLLNSPLPWGIADLLTALEYSIARRFDVILERVLVVISIVSFKTWFVLYRQLFLNLNRVKISDFGHHCEDCEMFIPLKLKMN